MNARTVDGFIEQDARGVISSWSAESEPLFGWARGEAIGMHSSRLIPERNRARHNQVLEKTALALDSAMTPAQNEALQTIRSQAESLLTVVNNRREALDALQADGFELVLMDVQMPEMDGFEATAAIRDRERATGQRVRISAMTAHAMKGDKERRLAAGMYGYLSEPIDQRSLFAAVEE